METVGAWVAGYNMPGCLPEMEPFATAVHEDAKRFLIDELLRHADSEAVEEDEAITLTHSAEDLNLVNGAWDDTIGNTAYWLTWNPDVEPDCGAW